MPYNLASPNRLDSAVDLSNLDAWFEAHVGQVSETSVRRVLELVSRDLGAFVRWPVRALLLWPDCNRVADVGKRQRIHRYPDHIKSHAKTLNVNLDTRPNGPAIAAFEIAGGIRPLRFGSTNRWSIHHMYSGKFPYIDRFDSLHATKDGVHFTQTAGLVAMHPIADAMSDEYPFFSWYLRALAFERFGYDPDRVFSSAIDEFGFAAPHTCEMIVN